MSTMNLTNLSNTMYGWLTADKMTNTLKQLSDNQILNMANEINGLFTETNLVESRPELLLPELVVVGTQSSGKSSVLNNIMSFDLLPVGSTMTTRTPLSIRLHQVKSMTTDGYVEFGEYTQEGWQVEKKINIKLPVPQDNEINAIRDFIVHKTNEIAGPGMNISAKPIVINIYAATVPNLSLVDLPGLTVVACTDKGQPEDIKERIEELVSSYITNRRTIVLAVMQARSDLEADIGLGLIKKKSNLENQKIIGVITKPDLMNPDTHVGEYLTNNISKSLMLTYGYYVIKNRSSKEMKDANILKGYEIEKEYFTNHPEYRRPIYRDRIGTSNLTGNLNKILISSISEMLPSVMTEIISLESKLNKKLEDLGQELPASKEGKLQFMNKYISNFSHRFVDSIESRGNKLNTGKLIKDRFIEYRQNLLDIRPFDDKTVYNSEYYKHIISSFEGNHMSFHIPPIQILEACMADNKHRPIMKLQGQSLICVDGICNILINLVKEISIEEEFALYPQLAAYIMTILIDEIISKSKSKTKDLINELLRNENDYIWTDNKDFVNTLSQVTKSENYTDEAISKFLEGYFSSVKQIVAHLTPKIIMSNVVREIEKSMLSLLLQSTVTEDKIHLLKQDEEIEKQRDHYKDLKNRVLLIKKNFSKAN